MVVPIDLLKPIFDDLHDARPAPRPAPPMARRLCRPRSRIASWSSAAASAGRPRKADLRNGDIIVAVAGQPISSLAAFYRRIKEQGEAGVEVPLTIHREGKTFELRVPSSDRARMFKAPRLH